MSDPITRFAVLLHQTGPGSTVPDKWPEDVRPISEEMGHVTECPPGYVEMSGAELDAHVEALRVEYNIFAAATYLENEKTRQLEALAERNLARALRVLAETDDPETAVLRSKIQEAKTTAELTAATAIEVAAGKDLDAG